MEREAKDTDLHEHVHSWDKAYEHASSLGHVHVISPGLGNKEDKFSM